MIKTGATLLALVALTAPPTSTSSQTAPLLARRYVEGDRLHYRMSAQNDGQTYDVRITAIVRKGSDGRFVEEFAWSDLRVNGTPRELRPSSQAFRLEMTLGGGQPFVPPDLSTAPGLIGPVTDVMTFYADLFLAMHAGSLRKPGDHFTFPGPMVGSWADGNVVVLGEDHVDFDITLVSIDPSTGTAHVVVKHLPPAEPKIRLPAEWMRERVADTPNNFVQVRKTDSGFVASVGKETFDVALAVDLSDGKIVRATMDNPVIKINRECTDAALTQCGAATPSPTLRQIEMSLVRDPAAP